MSSETKYAQTIQQTTGGYYAEWENLNNIKNDTASYADCTPYGKSAPQQANLPNRPSKIVLTNFGFQIPTGAKITEIKVEYHHKKITYMEEPPGIPAPTITLKNVGNASKKGYAPTETETALSTSFSISPNADNVNSSSFGVEFDYPENTNEKTGRVDLRYIRITVIYTPLDYELRLNSINPVYTGDVMPLEIQMVDKNRNGYDPTVEISLPEWIVFRNANGQGSITQSGDKLYWKVPFSKVGMGASITLYFMCVGAAANQYVVVHEPLTHRAETYIYTIIASQSQGWVVEEDDTNIVVTDEIGDVETLYVAQDTEIPINIQRPAAEDDRYFQFVHSEGKSYKYSLDNGQSWTSISESGGRTVVVTDSLTTVKLKYSTLGRRTVQFKSSTGGQIFKTYTINVIPPQPGMLSASILKLDSETKDRMADGYVYTAQSYIKIVQTVQNKEFIDCRKNCRMMVFNDEIPTGTLDVNAYIIENAEFISDIPETINDYADITCDFAYHHDYDVYIIFTSDYSALSENGFKIQYTSPALVEKSVYRGYEYYGLWPYPINNAMSNRNLTAIRVPLWWESSRFVISDFPVSERYGSGGDTAVVGIQLEFNLEYSDQCVLYARLRSPKGEVGTRSVILNEKADNEGRIVIGGANDLFGFDVLDIEDFNKWEIELQFHNIFSNEEEAAILAFNNAAITLYTVFVEDRYISMSIDGKDTKFYGLYLEDVEIPEGLETDTKYLEVDGTDTNEAYRMNIDKKTIKIEFSTDGCDIHETTMALRRISKLLVNKRDSLNRPIPRRVEFSHYPDVHWMYVMPDAIDTKVEYGNYTAKAKLVIPSGTANSNEDQVTNAIGSNNSLAKVNPIIQIIPTAYRMQITERYTNQVFEINNTSLVAGDVITIDCIKRRVTVKKNGTGEIQDISSSVDYNSDWFIIQGEYFFESSTCMIQTVTFNERW